MRAHVLHLAAVAAAVAAGAMLAAGCGSDAFIPVTGTVYGTVLMPGGSPAAGARVIVEGTGRSALTDSRGRFVINDLIAVREGQIGVFYDLRGEHESGGVAYGFVKLHFKVKEQQSYSIGTVTLQATGTIRGAVSLEGETDASGVRVGIEGLSLEAVTNAAGAFILDRVPAYDLYTIACEHPGFANAGVDSVAVTPGGETVLAPAILTRLP